MLSFSLENFKFYAFLLILKMNVNIGLSQFLNDTQVLAIADDIRNRRFTSAQELILSNQLNSAKVAQIVHHVYSNAENTSIILVDFAHEVNEATLSYSILRALYNEMTAHNQSDPLHLIPLYGGFIHELFVKHKHRSYQLFSPEIETILNDIKAKIETNAKQIVKDALISNNFESNVYAKNVTSQLYTIIFRLDAKIFRELAHETYAEGVPASQLVDNMMIGSVFITQRINFFLALYRELELNKDLNNLAVQKIAFYLRSFMKLSNYKKVSPPKRHAVNEVIKKMPICVQNLFFGSDLCIWNRGRSEYLYADRSQHNLSRRGIFTYGSNDLGKEGLWIGGSFTGYLSSYYFKSLIYGKEYLYASTTDLYDSKTRHVLTWADDGFVGETSNWIIELNGDFCYIKNYNFNEYLFVSDKMHSKKKRYVFTAISDPKLEDHDFQWQIRNCG